MWIYIQATLCCIHGPRDPELYQNPKTNRDNIHSNTKADGTMQTPHEVALQNDNLSDGSKWRTFRVPPPHCKPIHKSHMAALIWKQDWAPCPRNCWLSIASHIGLDDKVVTRLWLLFYQGNTFCITSPKFVTVGWLCHILKR